MAGNSFGKLFRLTTFGESHGEAIGGVIDGCPAGLRIDLEKIQEEMNRRKPGQSAIVTQRKEPDTVKFLSGIFEGKTTGTPIGFVIENANQKSKDYSHIKDVYRPSHADYTYEAKYGRRDYRGGGRASARETVCRVAAGAIAKKILEEDGMRIFAYVHTVYDQNIPHEIRESIWFDFSGREANKVRCPHRSTANQMIRCIEEMRDRGDTVGGIIECVVKPVPAGLGEPVYDKLHASLSKGILSINACKGFEIGSGFGAVGMKGSEHNDLFEQDEEGQLTTKTNYSGGIQGGISNGQPIVMRCAFKPVSTLMKDQASIDKAGDSTVIEGKGRHDPCVLPRAVPIVEAMVALTLADFYLLNLSSKFDNL